MARPRGTILVVDDEVDVLEMIEVGLGLDGYRVLLADSGEKAIEVITRSRVDLVISDLRMPGMNGVQTIARLREKAPRVPVIVVTGYLAPGTLDDCMALGGVNLLRKPFRFKNLTRAVQAALDRAPVGLARASR
ncbi:MAG TPA: response regulator [Kofleriaceae bacterium]|nr:response regulator [Kofleriaceae bacterium]